MAVIQRSQGVTNSLYSCEAYNERSLHVYSYIEAGDRSTRSCRPKDDDSLYTCEAYNHSHLQNCEISLHDYNYVSFEASDKFTPASGPKDGDSLYTCDAYNYSHLQNCETSLQVYDTADTRRPILPSGQKDEEPVENFAIYQCPAYGTSDIAVSENTTTSRGSDSCI